MTNMTVNGVTTTKSPGQEQYESYLSNTRINGKRQKRICYDYRHTDGELFSCTKPTLEQCREARDAWLERKGC